MIMKLVRLSEIRRGLFGMGLICPLFLQAAPRDVQFRSIDFQTAVVELHNFGTENESLDGWRFCTHDDNQERRYSSASALNGITLAPGDSLFFHVLDDAPANDPTRIDFPGTPATPMTANVYAIQIYFPGSNGSVSFGNGALIADHLQWSIDGVDNTSADARSASAQSGGVWTDQSQWIATTAESEGLLLTDSTVTFVHGPESYTNLPFPIVVDDLFRIESITIAETGEVTLTWPATAGASYEVFRSTDLSAGSFETPLATVTDAEFVDTNPPANAAFYRVRRISPSE